jgi:3-oxoacyl-[acyl-carrier protein] reductase
MTAAYLEGRVVLVTGAGRGVGRGIALACAERGASIVVAAPKENGAETVARVTEAGGNAIWVKCDVTSATEVEGAVAAAVTEYGRLDGVVHNATSRHSSEAVAVEDLTRALWDDHIAVSLRGAYLCARASFEELRKTQGRLVLMTSPAGMEGSKELPAYAAVKGALRGMVRSLAIEWGHAGVRVAAVSPLAQTDALDNAYRENPGLDARLRAIVPLGRVGDPETDIGPVVAFLMGDDSRYVNGQTLIVDGGRFTSL